MTGLIVLLLPAAALADLCLAGVLPRQERQCPLHEDCDGDCPDLTVAAAEFATRGYTDFDHWQGDAA